MPDVQDEMDAAEALNRIALVVAETLGDPGGLPLTVRYAAAVAAMSIVTTWRTTHQYPRASIPLAPGISAQRRAAEKVTADADRWMRVAQKMALLITGDASGAATLLVGAMDLEERADTGGTFDA